jgi:hypothetical protein
VQPSVVRCVNRNEPTARFIYARRAATGATVMTDHYYSSDNHKHLRGAGRP